MLSQSWIILLCHELSCEHWASSLSGGYLYTSDCSPRHKSVHIYWEHWASFEWRHGSDHSPSNVGSTNIRYANQISVLDIVWCAHLNLSHGNTLTIQTTTESNAIYQQWKWIFKEIRSTWGPMQWLQQYSFLWMWLGTDHTNTFSQTCPPRTIQKQLPPSKTIGVLCSVSCIVSALCYYEAPIITSNQYN